MSEPRDIYEKWDAEDRAMRIEQAKVMAAWSAGWALRRILSGALIALGAWGALRLVGAV